MPPTSRRLITLAARVAAILVAVFGVSLIALSVVIPNVPALLPWIWPLMLGNLALFVLAMVASIILESLRTR